MNLTTIILIVALILVILLVMKARHFKHRFFAVVFILIIIFIYITSTRVLAEYNINWKSVAGIEKAVKVYFVWIGGAFDNLKTLTGNVVKMDWGIKNKTAADNIIKKE